MLQKRTFRHFWRENMANRYSTQHDDVINSLKPTVAWRQKWSEFGGTATLQSEKNLSVEKRRETYILSNEEKEKRFQDYVDRETAVATKRVQDTETAIMEE